jgi:hypothetical protein
MCANSKTNQKEKKIVRPFSVNHIMEWFATILLLVAILTGIAGLIFPISHPMLVRKVTNYLHKCGADSCSVGSVTIKIWQGIEITDLYFTKRMNSLEQYSFKAEKLLVNANLLSSLMDLKKFRELPGKGKEYLFYELYREPQYYLGEWFRFLNQYRNFRGINIIEPHLQILGYDSLHIDLKGGIIDVSNNYEKKEMGINYQIGSAIVNGVHVEFNKGTLLLDEKNLKIVKGRGAYLNGKYKMAGDIDLFHSRCNDVQIGITDLQMSSLYSHFRPVYGKIDGKINIDLRLDPSVFHYDSLSGSGGLVLEDVSIAGTSLQNTISSMIMCHQIDTLHFDKIKNDFDLKKNLTFFNLTHGTGDEINFSAKGWIHSDGSLNQNVEAVFNEKFVKKLQPVVVNSLIEGENGNRIFKCKVYGNSSSPRVALDSTVLRNAIGSVFDDMKENFKYLFKKKSSGE